MMYLIYLGLRALDHPRSDRKVYWWIKELPPKSRRYQAASKLRTEWRQQYGIA